MRFPRVNESSGIAESTFTSPRHTKPTDEKRQPRDTSRNYGNRSRRAHNITVPNRIGEAGKDEYRRERRQYKEDGGATHSSHRGGGTAGQDARPSPFRESGASEELSANRRAKDTNAKRTTVRMSTRDSESMSTYSCRCPHSGHMSRDGQRRGGGPTGTLRRLAPLYRRGNPEAGDRFEGANRAEDGTRWPGATPRDRAHRRMDGAAAGGLAARRRVTVA